ncbi:HDOD domain-containing protein [Permianibacter sp. IMCC34836]|uniref:HDOD domain-containing protein n=1 Tax=Permianibacter fluminis TaxID=2738515 RepID=UPI001551B03C|nr:HDOD domain-containing protein [Permianibacter fluminis]NQD38252.1 HDOD domain-containing protein [Permianibacter fluminis]
MRTSKLTLQQEQQEWSDRLQQDLRLQRLQLPSLPEITQRLREAVADRNISVRALAQVLSAEPVLVAKLMQAASASWIGLEPPANLEVAITRIGMQSVRGIVYNYCLSKLFKERQTGPLRDELRKIWQRATLTAACAQMLASKLALENSHALLAGMMHNIGALPILSLFGQQRELAGRIDLMKLLLASDQALLGEAILQHWQMPDDVIAVPRGLAHEGDADSPVTVDVIRLALELAKWQEVPNSTVPAIDNFPPAQRLHVDRRKLEPWLTQSRKEIQSFLQMLQN